MAHLRRADCRPAGPLFQGELAVPASRLQSLRVSSPAETSLVWQEGTVIMEHGEPMPEEVQAKSEEPDEEQRLFIITGSTGTSIDDVLAQQFKVFA
jgi:hypothetical protein